jgi:outer membrane protein TolC
MGRGVAVAGASVLSLIAWGCNVTEPPPFDPQAITRADQERSAEVRSGPMPPIPTTMESYGSGGGQGERQARPPTTGRTVLSSEIVRMPIREIMQRAAANNPEVRVAGYDMAINETKVVENEAHYDPIFYTNVKWDKQFDRTPGTVIPNPNNPTSAQNVLITVENNNIYTIESGVKQYLPSGGQVSLSYQTVQSQYNPVRYVLNNYWDNELKMQLTQPLLRDFGYEVNWARVTIARNDQRVSMFDFRKALEDNINELEKDYWQLYEAQREVDIQERLLHETRDLANLLWQQSLIGGKATHVEASQGIAAVYGREAVLVRAKAHAADISDDIKRRMGDAEFAVAGPIEVLPADAPVEEKVEFKVDDQIETALLNRLELGQQQIRVNSAQIAMQVALNGLYPKLDFVASASLQGLAQNFSSAFSDQISSGHGIYSAGLQLEIPLGNREARSIYMRALLQRLQAVWAYHNLVNQVEMDVSMAVREVETSWNELKSAREARYRQEDVLTGFTQRRVSGVQALDPQFVQLELDQQERLAEAQRTEATAIQNYNIALGRLEKAKGTILRYNNIIMKEDVYPRTSTFPPGSLPHHNAEYIATH